MGSMQDLKQQAKKLDKLLEDLNAKVLNIQTVASADCFKSLEECTKVMDQADKEISAMIAETSRSNEECKEVIRQSQSEIQEIRDGMSDLEVKTGIKFTAKFEEAITNDNTLTNGHDHPLEETHIYDNSNLEETLPILQEYKEGNIPIPQFTLVDNVVENLSPNTSIPRFGNINFEL